MVVNTAGLYTHHVLCMTTQHRTQAVSSVSTGQFHNVLNHLDRGQTLTLPRVNHATENVNTYLG